MRVIWSKHRSQKKDTGVEVARKKAYYLAVILSQNLILISRIYKVVGSFFHFNCKGTRRSPVEFKVFEIVHFNLLVLIFWYFF